ncbi:MAG: PHP domain-containing protein [Gemmataceae bacterium]|nr:PHP domain-containing protein [Gemmataceae bacterium]
MVDLARERGLDGVCFTEHDRWWPEEEMAALGRRTGFFVCAGVELTTDVGHLLAFGVPGGTRALVTLEAAFAVASQAGGLLYLAHPARDGLLRVDRRMVEALASVEAVNGSDSRLQNVAATGLARGFRLPGVGGSDAHTTAEVGRAATRFEGEIGDGGALVAALASGCYVAARID